MPTSRRDTALIRHRVVEDADPYDGETAAPQGRISSARAVPMNQIDKKRGEFASSYEFASLLSCFFFALRADCAQPISGTA